MIVDPNGHFSLPLSACVCVRVRVSEQVGEYQQISDFNNLRASLSRYYSFFATESTTGTTVITVPYYDAFGLGEFCGKFCSSLAFLLHVAAAANPAVCVVPRCGGICGVPCCGGICGVPCCGGIFGVVLFLSCVWLLQPIQHTMIVLLLWHVRTAGKDLSQKGDVVSWMFHTPLVCLSVCLCAV